jgi:cyclohexanecarboxylate-CoA ligase
MISRHGLTAGDVFHMGSTVGHLTGFLWGVRLPLYLGGRAVYQEVWDAAEFIRLVEAESVTFTAGATPFLSDTLRAPNLAERDTRSLRMFFCGGAPIPQTLAAEAEAVARAPPPPESAERRPRGPARPPPG